VGIITILETDVRTEAGICAIAARPGAVSFAASGPLARHAISRAPLSRCKFLDFFTMSFPYQFHDMTHQALA